MTMDNYIKFVFFSSTEKTQVFEVQTKDGSSILGYVKWFGRWRCYSFFPEKGTVYEKHCLRYIADFCETKTFEHRNRKK